LDDFLVILPFFQSLSPIVYLAIVLLNQKKKIDYFFQIYEIQAHISRKNPNFSVIYLFRHIFTRRNTIKLGHNVFPAPTPISKPLTQIKSWRKSLLFYFSPKDQRF